MSEIGWKNNSDGQGEAYAAATSGHYFTCPECGGHYFGRDTSRDERGEIVVLETVRCHGDDCEWRGKWPPLPGRPPIAGETATGHIHIRSTMARKNAYVRAAKPKSLAAWATEILDKASGYENEMKNVIENLINGNLTDARLHAQKYGFSRLYTYCMTVLCWSESKAFAAAEYLAYGGQDRFNRYWNAE